MFIYSKNINFSFSQQICCSKNTEFLSPLIQVQLAASIMACVVEINAKIDDMLHFQSIFGEISNFVHFAANKQIVVIFFNSV
jgi:hypothetical protein